ncbi:hypothetical protein [Peterkaempfera bronchialis]
MLNLVPGGVVETATRRRDATSPIDISPLSMPCVVPRPGWDARLG